MKVDNLVVKIRVDGPHVMATVFSSKGDPNVAIDTMLLAILQMESGEMLQDEVIERTTARMKEIATTLVLPKEAIDC